MENVNFNLTVAHFILNTYFFIDRISNFYLMLVMINASLQKYYFTSNFLIVIGPFIEGLYLLFIAQRIIILKVYLK